jgi:hypothetical protein
VDEVFACETEEIDLDKAEATQASDFEEEEDPGDSEIGDFLGGIDDLGTMVSVGREEVGENGEMPNDFASV